MMTMAAQARAGTPQPMMMNRMAAAPPGPSRSPQRQPPLGYGMSPQGTPVNTSLSLDPSGRASSRPTGTGQNSLNNSPIPATYFSPSTNGSTISNNFLPQYPSGMPNYAQPPPRQPSPQPQGLMMPPRPPAAAMGNNGGGGRFHQNQQQPTQGGGRPQSSGDTQAMQGYGSPHQQSSPNSLGGGYSGAPQSLLAQQPSSQQYQSQQQQQRPRQPQQQQQQQQPQQNHYQSQQQQQLMPRPPQGPPHGGTNARPNSASPRMNPNGWSAQQQQQQQQQQQGMPSNRNFGRGIYGRKPVARGPQPTDFTATRGPDGRRIKDVRQKQQQAEANAAKPPPRLSPQLNGKRGKVTPQGEVVHKIKTTVDNDETWVQNLVYSTWVDSPNQSFAGGGGGGGGGEHYKREPNKRSRKDAHKAREKAKKNQKNNASNDNQPSSDDELSSGGLSTSSSQPQKKSKFVEALRGLFR